MYVADDDGDIAIFNLHADPQHAMKQIDGELHPINARPEGSFAELTNMANSVYTSAIFANGTLFIASRNMLFAIRKEADTNPKPGS